MLNTTSSMLMEKDEQIAVITLNRPQQLNAFNTAMRDQLYEMILAVRDDPTIEAVVLRGEGKGFCSGADLSEFGTTPAVIQKRRIRIQRDLWEEIRRLPKPTAAVLHGFAVGSGLEMSMLCDFRFAAPKTILSLPESQIGMVPAAGGTQSLPRLVKHGLALEFSLSGKRITAEEAYKMNLVSRIVPTEELLTVTVEYMKKIVAQNAKSARAIKSLVAHGRDMPLAQGLAREKVLVEQAWNWRKANKTKKSM